MCYFHRSPLYYIFIYIGLDERGITGWNDIVVTIGATFKYGTDDDIK